MIVADWMPFKYDADGGLTLYFQNESPDFQNESPDFQNESPDFQNESPGKDREANWCQRRRDPSII